MRNFLHIKDLKNYKYVYLYLFCIMLLYFLYHLSSIPINIGKNIENQKLQSVSYTPYGKYQNPNNFEKCDQECKIRMDNDLKILSKNFSLIRTYSIVGYENIMPLLEKYNMKIYLGAWINSNEKDSLNEINGLIKLAKGNEYLIEGIILGNEAFLRNEIDIPTMKSYIKIIKDNLPNVKITMADTWNNWIDNIELANDVDYLMVHILPYWESQSASEAIEHLNNKFNKVKEELNNNNIYNKEIRIGESGYPSQGEIKDNASPSPLNQALYLRSFINFSNKNNINYNIIEAFDQPWKKSNEGMVGAYWGIYDSDRNSKGILEGNVEVLPLYNHYFYVSFILFSIMFYIFKFKLIQLHNNKNLLFFNFNRNENYYFLTFFSFYIVLYFNNYVLLSNIDLYFDLKYFNVTIFLTFLSIFIFFHTFNLKNLVRKKLYAMKMNLNI